MKYRGRSDIIYAILKNIENNNTTKTRIMYSSYLSYTQTNEYLDLLIARNLVTPPYMRLNPVQSKEVNTYSVTEKGMNFMQKYEELMHSIGADSL